MRFILLIGLSELEKEEVKSPAKLQFAVLQTEKEHSEQKSKISSAQLPLPPPPHPPLSSVLANILMKKEKNLSFISFMLTHTNRAPLH